MTCVFTMPADRSPAIERGSFAYPGVNVQADEDSHVTGAQAARRLGLSRNAVHKWYYEGRIQRTEDGLYSYREVQELELKMRPTGMAHRGARVLVAA